MSGGFCFGIQLLPDANKYSMRLQVWCKPRTLLSEILVTLLVSLACLPKMSTTGCGMSNR